MSEQPLNLNMFRRVVWRHRFVVGACAALGVAGGVAHVVLLPPLPEARVLVVLPASSLTTSSGATANDTPTQVIIATSTPVLAAAGAAVSPPVSASALRGHTSVTSLSSDVLQFQVSASRSDEAEKLANAEAAGYIAYINQTGSASSTGVVAALNREHSALTGQIEGLQQQIDATTSKLSKEQPGSSAGQRDASLLASLGTEQQQVSLQLDDVNNEIVSTQYSGTLSAQATRVLQPATIVPASKSNVIFYPLLGAVLGLVIGCFVVLRRAQRDRRLHSRDELAGAIGVPVLASLDGASCRTTKDWRRLLQTYRPSTVDSWNMRRLLHRLTPAGADHTAELNVVAFADDKPALSVGAKLARTGAELGMAAVLVPGPHPSLGILRAACTLLCDPRQPDELFRFEAKTEGAEFSTARLVVSVDAVDHDKPLLAPARARLLAVSAGFATAEALATVALAAMDAGHPIDGMVVVNPEAGDSTAGVVPHLGEARPFAGHASHRAGTERSVGHPR